MDVPYPIKRPGVDVVLTLEVFEEDGEVICGLRWLEGMIVIGGKSLFRAFVEELAEIEKRAKAAGCREIRHSGDLRSRLFPDYQPKPGLRNGLYKRL